MLVINLSRAVKRGLWPAQTSMDLEEDHPIVECQASKILDFSLTQDKPIAFQQIVSMLSRQHKYLLPHVMVRFWARHEA